MLAGFILAVCLLASGAIDQQVANTDNTWLVVDALIKASSQRLRPILMTTGAMVLGAVPLAMAHGAGAESRQQIGWVIVGGMSLGTLLTVFVVPTMYSFFARAHVPGANKAQAVEEPAVHHGDLVAK